MAAHKRKKNKRNSKYQGTTVPRGSNSQRDTALRKVRCSGIAAVSDREKKVRQEASDGRKIAQLMKALDNLVG